MQSTALILRPRNSPEIRVLECDGPPDMPYATVNRFPGTNLPGNYLSFEDFAALPDYAKFPGPSPEEIEFSAARRIYRLIEYAERAGGHLYPRQLLEIRGRLKSLHPFCDEDF